MTINKGSRYEYASIEYYKNVYTLDSHPVLWYQFDDIGSIRYREYTWKYGDRLDLVAEEFYNNSSLWWVIMEHNPEISDPLQIPAGKKLRIPNGV